MKAIASKTAGETSISGKQAVRDKVSHAGPGLAKPADGAVLHRKCACGGGCPRCEEEKLLQTKLPLEKQADMLADRLMRFPNGTVSHNATTPPIVHAVLSTPGRPLPESVRAFAEPRFDADFSHVRIHDDALAASSARAVNAVAYTAGRDIVFDSGQYSPKTALGRKLIAHELAHVLQNVGSAPLLGTIGIAASAPAIISSVDDPLEVEADKAAEAVVSGASPAAIASCRIPGGRSAACSDRVTAHSIPSYASHRLLFRQSKPTLPAAVATPPKRLVHLDSSVIDKINRGSQTVVNILKQMRKDGVSLEVPRSTYAEMTAQGKNLQLRAANKLLIADWGFSIAPDEGLAARVTVYNDVAVKGTSFQSKDMPLVANAKLAQAEILSFDDGVQKNAIASSKWKPPGSAVKLAKESLTTITDAAAKPDYLVGRKISGFAPVTIDANGVIIPAVKPPGGGGGGGSSGGVPSTVATTMGNPPTGLASSPKIAVSEDEFYKMRSQEQRLAKIGTGMKGAQMLLDSLAVLAERAEKERADEAIKAYSKVIIEHITSNPKDGALLRVTYSVIQPPGLSERRRFEGVDCSFGATLERAVHALPKQLLQKSEHETAHDEYIWVDPNGSVSSFSSNLALKNKLQEFAAIGLPKAAVSVAAESAVIGITEAKGYYTFQGSTSAWKADDKTVGGPWLEPGRLKMDIPLGDRTVILSNKTNHKLTGKSRIEAQVYVATWGSKGKGITARLFVRTGKQSTWYDGGASIKIQTDPNSTILKMPLSSVPDLDDVSELGVQFTFPSDSSGTAVFLAGVDAIAK